MQKTEREKMREKERYGGGRKKRKEQKEKKEDRRSIYLSLEVIDHSVTMSFIFE